MKVLGPSRGRPVDAAKRAAVLTAAQRLFSHNGFAGTSMDSIAKAAGATKLTVYRNFGSKQDLFAEKMRYSDVAAIADFDDFEGESGDTDGAFDYFIDKFQSCLPNRSDDLVVPFDPETSDVATILQEYAKRFREPAQRKAATVTSQSAHKPPSLVVEQSKPSAAIEVTCVDGEEFYTETIEV